MTNCFCIATRGINIKIPARGRIDNSLLQSIYFSLCKLISSVNTKEFAKVPHCVEFCCGRFTRFWSTFHWHWRNDMESFPTLPALYEGNPLFTGEISSHRWYLFDGSSNKLFNKHSSGWWSMIPWPSCDIPLMPCIGVVACLSLCLH